MAACEMWSVVSADWERLGEHVERAKAEVTARLLAAAEPLDGARVLELGAGTGRLAERLADAVGPAGSVCASDAADGMVALLTQRLDGRPTVEIAQIDATELPVDDASVDVVVFRMGLMMAPDPDAALRDIRRVLRPGGRFVTAVWAEAAANPWMTSVGMAAMVHGLVPGPPPVGRGGPFSLGDPDELRALFDAAGFTGVEVQVVDTEFVYADTAAHVEMVCALAPPLSGAIGAGSPDQVRALQRTVAEATTRYRTADGVAVPARAVVACGTAA